MTSRVEELQRMCDNINENGGLDSGEWHTALLAQIAQNLAVIADVMMADRKIEPSFKVDGIGDDDPTIHAIAHLQKVGWLQEHDRALIEPSNSEKPNNCEDVYPCDTCKHNKLEWFSEVCDGCCGAHSNYEPKDEPQTERRE